MYLLSRKAVEDIKQVSQLTLGRPYNAPQKRARYTGNNMRMWLCEASEDIAARSGTQVSRGDCKILEVLDDETDNASRTTYDLSDWYIPSSGNRTQTLEKCYNISTSAVSTSDIVIVSQEQMTGRFFIVSGIGGGGLTGYKDVIFTLATTALTTSSSTNNATIHWQFGIGSTSPNTGAGAISVNNMPVSGGGYLFEGDVGDYGIAIWDNGNAYQIIQMECP